MATLVENISRECKRGYDRMGTERSCIEKRSDIQQGCNLWALLKGTPELTGTLENVSLPVLMGGKQ